MTGQKPACCSSPAAMCYWFAVWLIAWGVLSFVGVYWRPLHASSAATILFAMAIGCVANWFRNRTFHCGITGPVFFLAAFVFLLSELGMAHVNVAVIWPLVFVGVATAFLLEWRLVHSRS
jgi:hypothetical protein